MRQRSRHLLAVCASVSLALGAFAAGAQEIPTLGDSTSTTTSTTSQQSTTTLAPTPTTRPAPGGGDEEPPDRFGDENGTPAPEGASTGEDGDGAAAPPPGRIAVPAEAQRIIDSVVRSGPNNSKDLDAAISQLVDLGLTREEAYRAGFGRFIIAGPATFTHDWLFPRYGPGFRFHLGTDVFAPYGTPVRAPVDGVAESGNNVLGGLAVKVFMDDGTYFYMAHLSGLAEDFVDGMPVETGDIVGYVGTSGNAAGTPPHVHLGVYPQGGPAVDPKPILDTFLEDARARFPDVVAYYRQQAGLPDRETAEVAVSEPSNRALLSTQLLRPLTSPVSPPGALSTEVLFASTANPTGGAIRLAEDEAENVARTVDWEERQFLEETRLDTLTRGESLLRLALEPFVPSSDSGIIAGSVVRGS